MAYTTINDGSKYFQAQTYSGTGSGQSITNTGNSNLQPDWVWIKDMSDANDHKQVQSMMILAEALTQLQLLIVMDLLLVQMVIIILMVMSI